MNMVSRLQDENRRILKQQSTSPSHNPDQKPPTNDQFATTPAATPKSKDDKPASSGQADLQLMQRLRGQIEKQRHDLKMNELDLQSKTSEVENVISYYLFNVNLSRLCYTFNSTVNRANGSTGHLKP